MDIKSLSAEQLENAANMLKAIAHPVRIEILSLLDKGENLSVTEIHERLHLEQAATSHHLGILKNKGILGSKRNGKNTYYFLKKEELSTLLGCINQCVCN